MKNEFEEQQTQRAQCVYAALCKLPHDEAGVDAYQRKVNEAIREYLDADSIWRFASLCIKDAKAIMASEGGISRTSNDPKQQDKVVVRECWDAWQKRPEIYEGKAAFARDMRDKFPNLKSQVVIERWCRLWELETKTSPS